MNIILFVNRKDPTSHPVCFVTPDSLDGKTIEDLLPEKYKKKYHVLCIERDQPQVATDLYPMLKILKDGEDREEEDDKEPELTTFTEAGSGELKVLWNPADAREVQAIRTQFDRLSVQGFTAYAMGAKGRRGKKLSMVDPEAGCVIMVPPTTPEGP